MYRRYLYIDVIVLFFVASASSASLWSTILGGLTSFADGITGYLNAPVGAVDAFLSIHQLAQKYGYPLETHTVVTEDGYILNMHRMLRRSNVTSNGRAVFLMHGIWESSDSWMLQGPNKSLPYILADQGYDVWMGNARGNRHTLNHDRFNSGSSKFWEFSWEEIGLYDLPAMINYILSITGQDSVYYVGFSQGTTAYFVMTSMKPEYNNKIKLMFALAPEVFIGNAKNLLLKIFSPAHSYLQYILWNYNIYTPSTQFFNAIIPFLCKISPVSCDNLFFSIVGPHNVKDSLWPVILGHVPTGSSTLQFIHYGQLANTRRFCRFDFGSQKNLEKYGQDPPPDYDLKNVTSPVVLFYSGNDWFSDHRDVELLKLKLPKVVGSYYVKKFSHVDFMYADEASTLIYSNLIKRIQKDSYKRNDTGVIDKGVIDTEVVDKKVVDKKVVDKKVVDKVVVDTEVVDKVVVDKVVVDKVVVDKVVVDIEVVDNIV